jgi:hypothetical protein
MASNATVRRIRPRVTTARPPTQPRADVRPDNIVGIFCWD